MVRASSFLVAAATAQWPPGYPGILAAVYLLPGPDVLMAKLLNVVLGSLTCSMVYVLGRMLWGQSVGIVAGVLLTVFPSHIFYSTMVLTEVTYGAVITAIFLAFFWRLRRSGGAADVRFAFLLGLAECCRDDPRRRSCYRWCSAP
jgi:4-amino-4-deoxy-L-arabinose transferase-like glycosyltransferase